MRDEGILEQTAEEHPGILLRDDVQTLFDRTGVVKFIWKVMILDAIYAIGTLRPLNECLGMGSCSDQRAMAASTFAWLNAPLNMCSKYGLAQAGCGAWDFKVLIRTKFHGQWQQVNDTMYHFDIWTNMHFGYVGSAAGFSEFELLQGAGVAQILSDRFAGREPWAGSGAFGLAAFDEPHDPEAIQVGVDLWNKYQLSVSESNIVDTLESASGLNTTPPWPSNLP